MEKLNICPFCGSSEVKVVKGIMNTSLILCDKCGATVSFYGKEHEEQAVQAWNKRSE